MEETNTEEFEGLLKKTVEQLQATNATKNFAIYFTQFYACRKEQWAACYRKKSGINTNMYVESFFRLLKYIYMRGRSNKRVDKLIYVLMKVARDKAFDRLCKLEKGKVSGRLALITKRHLESTKLTTSIVAQGSSSKWTVVSSDGLHEYTVFRDAQQCPINCHLRCNSCNICVHSYSCNCMDALVNHTICKHIHLIAGNDKPTEGPNINKNTLSHDDLLINESHLSLEETAIPKQHKHNEIKTRLQQKLTTLMSQIQKVTNDEALLSAEKNINAAISVLHLINTSDTSNQLLPTKHSPENKK